MTTLPHNCRAGKFCVTPSNWNTLKASVKANWRLSYYFYDDNLKKKKKVVIRGIVNQLETLEEKQAVMRGMIEAENEEIKELGYNHISGKYNAPKIEEPTNTTNEINGLTPFNQALQWAWDTKVAVPETKTDMKNVLKYIKLAAVALKYDRAPISEIKRKHLKPILNKAGEIIMSTDMPAEKGKTRKGVWNSNRYNHFRKYLSAFYLELIEIEAVDANPITPIRKQSQLKRIRETVKKEQRSELKELLKDQYPFWRWVNIFFHSGARITELLNLKTIDVDLDKQQFKVIIKKGRQNIEKWRTIKTIALPFWNDVMSIAQPGEYLFSLGLNPGTKRIGRDAVTGRWERNIKKKSNITADLYSMKHLNLDEVAAILGVKEAQKAAEHTTPVITIGTYLTGEQERQHNRLKEVNNEL